MMSEGVETQGRRVEFVRRLPRRLRFVRPLSPRGLTWLLGLLLALAIAVMLHLAARVIEGHDETAIMFGHVMADGLVSAVLVMGAIGVLLFAGLIPLWLLKARTLWDSVVVADDGVTVSRRGRIVHAPWNSVTAIDVRTHGARTGVLRTRAFALELASLEPIDAGAGPTRWIPPPIAGTPAFHELAATRGVPVRRRFLRWEDALVVPILVLAVLPHLPLNAAAVADYQRAHKTSGDPAEELRAVDAWLARRPDDGLARSRRADALARLGRFPEARADAAKAVADDPLCGFTWMTRNQIADASRDPEWAVASWMQAHPGFSIFAERGGGSAGEVARWRVEIGRRLFMSTDFERARRWLLAAERDAAGMKEGKPMQRRIVTLVALCDIAQGRSEQALASLATMDEDSVLRRHVEALALRCLGREEEIDAVLARLALKPFRSESMKAANQCIDDWLRGEPVELPSSLAWSRENAILVNIDAPLLVLALRQCTAPPP